MKFPPLIEAEFIHRPNRFTAGIRLVDGGVGRAYVPTTGRLTGVLVPGCRVWLEKAVRADRKTPYTLVLAELGSGALCSVDAHLANRLFAEAVEEGHLSKFEADRVEAEVKIGRSRLDFKLRMGGQICWVEVKSVTYAAGGVAMFPDAPTARGRRHLLELARLVSGGDRAEAVFIVQRPDAQVFRPYAEIDPEFAETLRKVHNTGVGVRTFRCAVSTESVEILKEIPVEL